MQNVMIQLQKYPPVQGHPSSDLLLSDHHTARIIAQHRIERQETPQDPVPAERVSCSWTSDPTRTVWHSVPEVELSPGLVLRVTLQFRVLVSSSFCLHFRFGFSFR